MRALVSPEQCCAYYSMLAAEQRLKVILRMRCYPRALLGSLRHGDGNEVGKKRPEVKISQKTTFAPASLFFVHFFVVIACEQQTHFRSSLLSLRKIEKRRPEMCLLFAGYCRQCTITTWNFPILRFVEDMNVRQRFSLLFRKLWYSRTIQFQKKMPTFEKLKQSEWQRWRLKQFAFIFWVKTFAAVAVRVACCFLCFVLFSAGHFFCQLLAIGINSKLIFC